MRFKNEAGETAATPRTDDQIRASAFGIGELLGPVRDLVAPVVDRARGLQTLLTRNVEVEGFDLHAVDAGARSSIGDAARDAVDCRVGGVRGGRAFRLPMPAR